MRDSLSVVERSRDLFNNGVVAFLPAPGRPITRLPPSSGVNEHVGMRFSVNIPNFGDFADARAVAKVASAAEQAGWDGLFVWDHVVHDKERRRGQAFGDPWMLLTAAALATSRIRLGTLVTPVARRRPEQLARQVATLDSISGGRVIFTAGLGGPIEDEYGSFGDTTEPTVLAQRLTKDWACWSGTGPGSRSTTPASTIRSGT